MDTQTKFKDFIKKSNGQFRIPPLKMNIHVLIQAFADENISTRKLAEILNHYPVIVARLLGLANSAWANPATPITHIEAACVRIGMNLVKTVSLALAVASSFDTKRCPSFNPIRFWMTSMLVAEGGAALAEILPNQRNTGQDLALTVQTAGILHNLGLLWLADNLAEDTEHAFQLAKSEPLLTINQALESCIGSNYCQVGAWLFTQWGLPDEIINVVEHHHSQATESTPVVLIGASADMVGTLFQACPKTQEYPNLQRLGIEFEQQNLIFKQLIAKQAAIKELAEKLFS